VQPPDTRSAILAKGGDRVQSSQTDLGQTGDHQPPYSSRETNMPNRQQHRGGSGIGLIIMLAIAAYAVYAGLQYVPQYLESATVGAVLDNVAVMHKEEPFSDTDAIRAAINKQLYINQRNDLEDSFTVVPSRGDYLVTVRYERELDLLFTKKIIRYDKSVTLK
jgi:hypothetical protein